MTNQFLVGTILNKKICFFICLFCWMASIPSSAVAEKTTLFQSVEQALTYSPQLKALNHDYKAVEHDLNQSYRRYFPSVDLMLGSGMEQHSDSTTRQPGAVPSDNDWDSRGDASIRLTQPIYDGGEISQNIAIRSALLDSSDYRVQDLTQRIILDTIVTHLEVYRQRELLILAEKDLKVHQNIFQALSEKEQSGAGNIADVTQTQTRLSRAQSIMFVNKGQLRGAIANYKRMVGKKPGDLTYTEPLETLPVSLEEALNFAKEKNPELMVYKTNIIESDARVSLSRSSYKPKINIELSSRYHDQLEGDPSWQNTNDAMLVLRWNLFNGGQDREATRAALERRNQSRSSRDNKLIEIQESMSETWAAYISLQSQKKAYQDAVVSSEKTFDAYLKQFEFSRRSLIDVLNAEKEYFQSARQLVTSSVDQTIAAYRILKIGGTLKIGNIPKMVASSSNFHKLAQSIVVPFIAKNSPPEPQSITPEVTIDPPVQDPGTTEDNLVLKTESEAISSGKQPLLYSMKSGPYINQAKLDKARAILNDHNIDIQEVLGSGPVKMFRLFEGAYPRKEAYERLDILKKTTDSAFILPNNGQLRLYAGSFHDHERALVFMALLEQNQISVTMEECEIDKQGKILLVQHVEQKTANMIAAQMKEIGINVPFTAQDKRPEIRPVLDETTIEIPAIDYGFIENNFVLPTEPETISSDKQALLYSIKIGPCIKSSELDQVRAILNDHQVDMQEVSGSGPVRMFRLFEGVYPQEEALKRLDSIKKIAGLGFVLKKNGHLRLYAGSFHERDRALAFMTRLEQNQISVTLEECEIDAQGKILLAKQIELKTANMIAEQMTGIGLHSTAHADDS